MCHYVSFCLGNKAFSVFTNLCTLGNTNNGYLLNDLENDILKKVIKRFYLYFYFFALSQIKKIKQLHAELYIKTNRLTQIEKKFLYEKNRIF